MASHHVLAGVVGNYFDVIHFTPLLLRDFKVVVELANQYVPVLFELLFLEAFLYYVRLLGKLHHELRELMDEGIYALPSGLCLLEFVTQ